jgi:hypothetical protein
MAWNYLLGTGEPTSRSLAISRLTRAFGYTASTNAMDA